MGRKWGHYLSLTTIGTWPVLCCFGCRPGARQVFLFRMSARVWVRYLGAQLFFYINVIYYREVTVITPGRGTGTLRAFRRDGTAAAGLAVVARGEAVSGANGVRGKGQQHQQAPASLASDAGLCRVPVVSPTVLLSACAKGASSTSRPYVSDERRSVIPSRRR